MKKTKNLKWQGMSEITTSSVANFEAEYVDEAALLLDQQLSQSIHNLGL